ncbi:MAG: hypothetical protein KF773_38410 [Deltaproteobacteria bacterium]|nr:hypothetical protein [Deltaproteobacteria bacterium]
MVAPLASATQADVARDIDEAERRGTWGDVKKRWRKQPLTWTVTRREPLCRTAEACNVSAFPVAQGAAQGWMPRLHFAAGEFDRLAAACGGKETCEVTIDARLDKLELSADDPVNVTLGDVRIRTAGGVQMARR